MTTYNRDLLYIILPPTFLLYFSFMIYSKAGQLLSNTNKRVVLLMKVGIKSRCELKKL